MKYSHESWPVRKLVDLYEAKKLDLSPPYQRNPIWSSVAQKELVETVLKGRPMPNFFLLQRDKDAFEVVDGKQRALTLLAFWRGHLETLDGHRIDSPPPVQGLPPIRHTFLSYPLSVTVIHDLAQDESIQKFYALVNSTGLRLNRPEVRKAEFYTTNLLRLVTNLAGQSDFQKLGLFTRLSAQRMNDIDFVSELVAQIQFGITDKKEMVDDMYESDITEKDFANLQNEFQRVLACISTFDELVPIGKTRYRQKNDFYTLFGFIHFHPELTQPVLEHFYRILVRVGPYIRPSQERCEPLMMYALNCVTQSNSKSAREARLKFFEALLLNRSATVNDVQRSILAFFKLTEVSITRVGEYSTFRWEDMKDPDQGEFPQMLSLQ